MKYTQLTVSVLLLAATGCSDFLDYSESSFYDKAGIFSEYSRSKSFVTNIYTYLPSDFNSIDGAMRASATDEAVHVWDLSTVHKFNNGAWSPMQPLDSQWGKMYAGIRAVNLFLADGADNTFEDLRYNTNYAELMAQYRLYPYEVRFLRAFFYFELAKRYGDVPLVTSVLTEQEANALPRTSFDNVVEFIVSECNEISEHLPLSYAGIPGSETGRATRGAALALKARALLYAASPLHNNTEDAGKWVRAAQASRQLIDQAHYTLEGSYGEVVNNRTSPELILETREPASSAFEAANFPIGYEGGNTGTCPTQNLVDAYEMKATGKAITEDESGYDPGAPYTGRDPRLSGTILFNGAVWKDIPLEIWNGGLHAPPRERATKTGYYLKKYVMEGVSLNPTTPIAREHTWVIFRYGEVLLNYAEAMNEAYGPEAAGPGTLSSTALEAANQVRARAGMPAFPAGMTKSAFREKLRNERRVELAFEDHRFWDVRRWKIGNTTTEIHGITIQKTGTALTYTKKLVERRVWSEKMNLFPIEQSELFINPSLGQNEGW